MVNGHVVRSGKWFDLPAVLITLFTAYLIMRGTRLSARVNDVVVSLKVIAILAVIAGAAPYIHLHNWQPFIPPNTGATGSFGVSGVMRAAGILFFAYVGFDSISTLGQETKNPQRTIPLALMISLAVCVLLYVGVALVMTGIADYRTLNVADPIAEAMRAQGPQLAWARWCVSVVAIFGLVSVLLVTLLGQVRIFYAMGRDGLLPPAFARIHPKYCTPYVGSIVTGVGAALFAGLFPLDLLGDLVSIGTLLAFAVVSAGVLILRRTMPDAPRAFQDTVHAVYANRCGTCLHRADVFAIGGYVDTARGLAGFGGRGLCGLRVQALEASGGQVKQGLLFREKEAKSFCPAVARWPCTARQGANVSCFFFSEKTCLRYCCCGGALCCWRA